MIFEQGNHLLPIGVSVKHIRVDTVIVTVVGNVVMDAWHGNNVTASYNK